MIYRMSKKERKGKIREKGKTKTAETNTTNER